MSDAARARPDWQPATAPTAPTPSMLAYAFGERVAPPAGRIGGKLVPCSGRMVDGDELAVTIVHVALWDLERRERIALETEVAPGGAARTRIRPSLRAQLEDEFPGSLEQRLFRSARSGREDRDVGEVVTHLYQQDVPDPFAYLFELQSDAMLNARLMRRDVEGRVAAVPGVPPSPGQLVWLCENVARSIVSFATIQAEWERHKAQDPAAFERIHRAIRTAVEVRLVRGDEDP